jgi:hypothetical protein
MKSTIVFKRMACLRTADVFGTFGHLHIAECIRDHSLDFVVVSKMGKAELLK